MKFLSLLLILVIIPLVVAIPELPHQFYGTISDDNGLISSGTLTAKLCNIEFTAQIENGNYGLSEPFLITREDCPETNIEFYIDNHKIKDYTYESGAYTELNFNIPVFSTASDNENNNGSSSDNNHNSGSSNVKSKMYPVIQIDNNVVPDNNQRENQLSDKKIEQTSSQNFLSNLKDTTVKIVNTPFKTRKTTFFSLLIVCLLILIILYHIRKR